MPHAGGTGPYQVEKWTKGKSITLLRNEQWWDSKKPAIRMADFLFMSSAAETENMLAEGRIDALSSVTRLTASFMARTDYVMGQRGVEGKLLIAMNNARAPLNDIRVRRAINHALDRSRYQNIYGGSIEVLPIGSHFSPHHRPMSIWCSATPTTRPRPRPCSPRPGGPGHQPAPGRAAHRLRALRQPDRGRAARSHRPAGRDHPHGLAHLAGPGDEAQGL
ncbi:ABC transporter substrate-binding protein [Comamonas sp. JC664]|uniref:ABC transporter substrate-binding protein n=1 Tax=Comamonas sp. JC664 TaxID=2801917 RepID=UPI003618EC68